MKIKKKTRVIIVLSYFVLMAIILFMFIKNISHNLNILLLIVLNLLSIAFIYVSYTKFQYRRFNIFAIPVYLFALYFSYEIMPITNTSFDVLQKMLIGLFYFLLFFISGTFKK